MTAFDDAMDGIPEVDMAEMCNVDSHIELGRGDDMDVASGRCCPICRNSLQDHNVAVWNAGYSVGTRHAEAEYASIWNAGWHEHYLEEVRQDTDPRHPITKNNPYEGRR